MDTSEAMVVDKERLDLTMMGDDAILDDTDDDGDGRNLEAAQLP